MSDGFKKGFMITLGVMACLFIVGVVLKAM
jgi:hypothetical protein